MADQGTLPAAMLAALGLFLLIEVVGLLAAPLAALVLGRLPGAGLGLLEGARRCCWSRG